MKPLLLSLLTLSVSACVTAPSGSLDAYCLASEAAVASLAETLAETPDEDALRKGDLVVRQRDAACR
jgi:hypothetical protein